MKASFCVLPYLLIGSLLEYLFIELESALVVLLSQDHL